MPATDGRGSDRDPLTGLPGRATLSVRFASATATAQREGKRLGVLFVDLDGFKRVNDDLSHRAGDAALRHAARCLLASVRGADTVSRHGGDEFVILLTDLSVPADAARVAGNMLSSLRTPERIGEHAVSMSASIGISLYPDDGSDIEELIHLADGAMYRAKRRGPGWCVFHAADQIPGNPAQPTMVMPGVIYPHAKAMARERLRQGGMEESNEQLLLAALTARQMQTAAEYMLGNQNAMLARVAHELRNPLTPISVAASLMDAAHVDDLPQLRQLIERQVDHISRLVGDLLDVSRGQAGKLRLHRAVVDLRDICADALAACRPGIDARSQRVSLDLPGRALLVDGDRLRLVQVVTNLLDNASKYTPDEGAITVAADASVTEVVLRVSDNGIGIRPGVLAAVFHPFVQDAYATRFNGTGLGIGLAVVRELVEAHGGHVEAFSAGEGQGSRFVMTLPRHVGDGEADKVR